MIKITNMYASNKWEGYTVLQLFCEKDYKRFYCSIECPSSFLLTDKKKCKENAIEFFQNEIECKKIKVNETHEYEMVSCGSLDFRRIVKE